MPCCRAAGVQHAGLAVADAGVCAERGAAERGRAGGGAGGGARRGAGGPEVGFAARPGRAHSLVFLNSRVFYVCRSAEDSGHMVSSCGSLLWPRELLLRPTAAVHTSRLGAEQSFYPPASHLLLHKCNMRCHSLNHCHHGECKARLQRGTSRARRALPVTFMTCCRPCCAGSGPEILQAGAHRRKS